jgi:hypothetical protein
MLHNAYVFDEISLLVIERIRDIYIVSLQKSVLGMYAQFPFVPIHKSILEEFVSSAELIGTVLPSSTEASMEIWEKYGSAYFTVSPKEIWKIGISVMAKSGKDLLDYRHENYFLFPPVFPGTMDTLDGFDGKVGVIDHVIGEKCDPSNN